MISVSRWAPDHTRRFSRRPIYLSHHIEAMIASLRDAHGIGEGVISDESLESLVEQVTSDYDCACDLRYIADDVEGATQFTGDMPPVVMIDRRLSDPALFRRRRMTIAHEIGHVLLHAPLFAKDARADLNLFGDAECAAPVYCFREAIESGNDWMEWQASFAGAVLLSPSSDVHKFLNAFVKIGVPAYPGDERAIQMISAVSENFIISKEAAEVRLLQLRYLEPDKAMQALPLTD